MSKRQGQHPQEGDFLLYLDGELDEGASEYIRHHLDSCWSCRMRAASIQNAILEFAREREKSAIPLPPAPWRDLSGDFRRIQDSTRPSIMQRIRMGAIFKGGRVAMLSGAATAIAAVTWLSLAHKGNYGTSTPVQPTLAIPDSIRSSQRSPSKSPPKIAELRRRETLEVSRRPGPYAIIHEELAIQSKLHFLRADLGEPIELDRNSDERLSLTITGLSSERITEIQRALSQFPDLTIRVVASHDKAQADVNGPATSAAHRPVALEAELIAYLGGRQRLQALGDSLLDASDQITMYAHALTNLKQRFPATEASAMTPDDRALVDQIESDHRLRAHQAAVALQTMIQPIFDRFAIQSEPGPSQDLLETALKLDRLLNSAFAGAQSDLSDRDLYAELRGQLSRFLELIE